MRRSTAITLCKYIVAFGLLTAVVIAPWGQPGSHGLGDVWQKHVVDGQPIYMGFLLAAFLLFTAGQVVSLVRWYVLMRALDLPVTLGRALSLGMVGCFFNIFMPGSMGGDVVRATILAGDQVRRTASVASVVMDRLIAIWALFSFAAMLGAFYLFFAWLDGPTVDRCQLLILLSALGSGTVALGWLLLGFVGPGHAQRFHHRLSRLPRVGATLAELWATVLQYRGRKLSMTLAVLLSWLSSAGFILAFYCGAQAIAAGEGGVPTVFEHFLIVPIALVVQAGIPLPGGIGAGEWSLGALYSMLGGAKAHGILASLVLRLISWIVALSGGLFFLYSRQKRSIPQSKAQSLELAAT